MHGVAIASVSLAVASLALLFAQVPIAAAIAAVVAFGAALASRKSLRHSAALAGWGVSLLAFLISGIVLLMLVLTYVVPLLVFVIGEIL